MKMNSRKRPSVVPCLRPPVFGPDAHSHLKHCGVHHVCNHPHHTWCTMERREEKSVKQWKYHKNVFGWWGDKAADLLRSTPGSRFRLSHLTEPCTWQRRRWSWGRSFPSWHRGTAPPHTWAGSPGPEGRCTCTHWWLRATGRLGNERGEELVQGQQAKSLSQLSAVLTLCLSWSQLDETATLFLLVVAWKSNQSSQNWDGRAQIFSLDTPGWVFSTRMSIMVHNRSVLRMRVVESNMGHTFEILQKVNLR